jgi:hypothetical protein
MMRHYNFPLQAWGGNSVIGVLAGTFVSFLLGLLNPALADKAGPNWLWMGGRNDVIRALYFRPNGSFRRYGRLALAVTLFTGTAAAGWLLGLI